MEQRVRIQHLVFILIFCQTIYSISSHSVSIGTGFESLGQPCDQARYDAKVAPFWVSFSRGRPGKSGDDQAWADETNICFSGELIQCIKGECQCMKTPYHTINLNNTCRVKLATKCNGPSQQVFPCERNARCDTAGGKCMISDAKTSRLFCSSFLIVLAFIKFVLLYG